MKKLAILLASLLFSVVLCAQDNAVLEQILQINSAAKSFESDLRNTTIKPNKEIVQDGKLYFVRPDKFAALFAKDSYMISNANKLKIDIGMFHGSFTMRKNGMLRSLSNIFLYGFQGKCEDLAKENNYSISTKEIDGFQQVTFTNNRRRILGVGFKQIIYKFEKDSLKLREITLFDTNGTVDIYTISNVKYDVTVDSSHFDVP